MSQELHGRALRFTLIQQENTADKCVDSQHQSKRTVLKSALDSWLDQVTYGTIGADYSK
jgi:hypothetical protein